MLICTDIYIFEVIFYSKWIIIFWRFIDFNLTSNYKKDLYWSLLNERPCNKWFNYRPQRSCGQGYVFTRVCDSVHWGGVSGEPPPGTRQTPPDHGERPQDQGEPPWDQEELPPQPGRPPWDQAPPPDQGEPPRTKENPPGTKETPPPDQGEHPPPGRTLQHTVNERPVRILLECILVLI